MSPWTINKSIRTPLLLLCTAELLILYSAVYVAALVLYGNIADCELDLGNLVFRAFALALIMLASLVSMGLYHFHKRARFAEVLVRVVVGLVFGSLALAVVFYAIPAISVSHMFNLVSVLYALCGIAALRYFFLRNVDENRFRYRTFIYGAGERARAIADLRRKADRRGFEIVGSVPAPGDNIDMSITGLISNDSPVDRLVDKLGADEIVIAMDDRRGNLPIRELLNSKLSGVNVIDLVEFLERETGKIRIDLVNPGWLIFSSGFRSSRMRTFSKRAVDLIVCVLVFLLAWPLMIMIAVAIKIEDGLAAPVLYRQNRVGHRGNTFDLLKFRSMREDAEADGNAVWAKEHDERKTRVGNVLRKFRLDELPQILNVLRGQMSLVGPRPERPEFVAQLSASIPYYAERHTLKPGITGWAQLRYLYGASEKDAIEKLQFDLYYVKNHTFVFDFMILLQTVEVILWGQGAR